MKPLSAIQRFGGLLSLVISVVAAYAIGAGLNSLRVIGLVAEKFQCPVSDDNPEIILHLFSTKLHWQAMVTLEGVVAVFAVCLSVFILHSVAKSNGPGKNRVLWIILAVGGLILCWDIIEVLRLLKPSGNQGLFDRFLTLIQKEGSGLLSRLLATLPDECEDIRKSVAWARMIGEPPGLFAAVAMSAVVTFSSAPISMELARRNRQLTHLLYATSILFVIGLLVTRANLSWILAQWDSQTITQGSDVLGRVISEGVLASAVAYSGILLAFYFPIRLLLGFHVESTIPEDARKNLESRKNWLKENGFERGWREDLQQLIALLAPVISVPVFDAITKI